MIAHPGGDRLPQIAALLLATPPATLPLASLGQSAFLFPAAAGLLLCQRSRIKVRWGSRGRLGPAGWGRWPSRSWGSRSTCRWPGPRRARRPFPRWDRFDRLECQEVGLNVGVVAWGALVLLSIGNGLKPPEELDGFDAVHTGRKPLPQRPIGGHHYDLQAASDRLTCKQDDPIIGVLIRSKAVLTDDPPVNSGIGILRGSVPVVDDRYLKTVGGCEAIQHRFEPAPRFPLLLTGLKDLEGRVGEDGVMAVDEPTVSLRVLGPVRGVHESDGSPSPGPDCLIVPRFDGESQRVARQPDACSRGCLQRETPETSWRHPARSGVGMIVRGTNGSGR